MKVASTYQPLIFNIYHHLGTFLLVAYIIYATLASFHHDGAMDRRIPLTKWTS